MQAALQQIERTPRLIPLGHIIYTTPEGERSRHFLVMAGAGPDGMLVYKMLAAGKHSLRRAAYYLRAALLFAKTRFSPFQVVVESAQYEAVSAMAVRVGDLGGVFSPLIRGASICDPTLTLSLLKSPSILSLPAWFAMSWARLHRYNSLAITITAKSFACGSGKAGSIQVQADGEWLGRTPMSVSIVPNALRLLVPESVVTSSRSHPA